MAPSGTDHGAEARAGVQSVERALAILQLFRDGPDEMGISDIARSAGLSLSTAHRLVRALCTARYMDQDPETERYRLGASLFVLGQRALENSGYSVALPVLEHLTVTTGESTTLGIRRGNEIVVVLTTASQQRLRFDHLVGAGIGLHASAMGKAVLAFGQLDPAAAVAELGALEGYTSSTIIDPKALVADLTATHVRGYAINHEERYEGVSAVGAPVLDRTGVAQAALGVQGPTGRMSNAGFDALGAAVRAAANEVASLVQHGAAGVNRGAEAATRGDPRD